MTAPTIDWQAAASLDGCLRWLGPPPIAAATLKATPDDFVVEELPVYEPTGEGDFLFLWIEKRNLSAEQLRRDVARGLDLRPGDVGIAGNKDKRAVTRQYVSVPAHRAPLLPAIETPELRVLRAIRHSNKLRTGHLRGNRFQLRLRDCVTPAEFEMVELRLQQLATRGFPNYFGSQRFGGGQTLRIGNDLLSGTRTREALARHYSRSLVRLGVSAVQSAIFNAALSARIRLNILDRVQAGDIACFRDRRTHFLVKDPAAEQARLDAGELVLTGPLPGRKMTAPADATAALEADAISLFGLDAASFARQPKLAPGARRPLIQWPGDFAWSCENKDLLLTFTLPSGVYATALLRELIEMTVVPADSADSDRGPETPPAGSAEATA